MAISISETLRLAIQQQHISFYAISQKTGIDPSVLSRFVSGKRTLRLDTADVLAQYLNITATHSTNNTTSTQESAQ